MSRLSQSFKTRKGSYVCYFDVRSNENFIKFVPKGVASYNVNFLSLSRLEFDLSSLPMVLANDIAGFFIKEWHAAKKDAAFDSELAAHFGG